MGVFCVAKYQQKRFAKQWQTLGEIGNFRFATATKSSTATRFFSSIFLPSETFFHLFIYKHIFLNMVESKHA